MSADIISEYGFKSGYNAEVRLRPVTTVNSSLAKTPIRLHVVGNKMMPGFEDGESWTISTDDPEQEIAESIAGKLGGIVPLSFEVLYDPFLVETLVAHAKTMFTVEILYDDTEFAEVILIEIHKCFLKNPANTSGGANNAAQNMTVTLQPRGGGKLTDCIEVTKVTRS
jgi:hypothetical protein